MKTLYYLLVFLLLTKGAFTQHTHLVYKQFVNGAATHDTAILLLTAGSNQLEISRPNDIPKKPIPGLASEKTFIDYSVNERIRQLTYPDSSFFSKEKIQPIAFDYIADSAYILNYKCYKAQTSINSNHIEIWYTNETGFNASPVSWLGDFEGTILRIVRNGNRVIEADEISLTTDNESIIPDDLGVEMSTQQLNQLQKEKLVIRIPVFKNEQIFWGDTTRLPNEIPYDTTFHIAGGTLIFKRLQLPKIPDHYQAFAEITTCSNGDAYDRTGSVFIIPDSPLNFAEAFHKGVDVLPKFVGKDGEVYQGIKLTGNYQPVVELVRFFTPFGVKHFNEKVKIDGLQWKEKSFYKQDISDLKHYLSEEVIIGAYIGNYDKGGHILSFDLSFYPGSTEWTDENDSRSWLLPLFNTVNIMEMANQNYGKLFGTDTLSIAFEVPEDVENLRLRYISTGHGGWGGGDEFNPKENKIFLDGVLRFVHTPWRTDCATYRDLNPISGNFWNGMSSSDYSRSGWCPGEATEPVYFNLDDLAPGKHTISLVIPQGKPEGNSLSYWAVSGMLVGKKR